MRPEHRTRQQQGRCALPGSDRRLVLPASPPDDRTALHVVVGLARSRSLSGPWNDLGPILRARPERGWTDTWIGAGAVPLPLGNGRYLEIYHSGHLAAGGSRLYTLGATVLNFAQLDPARLESIVESRFDHFMRPETPWETEGPYPDSVGNVLFTCGAMCTAASSASSTAAATRTSWPPTCLRRSCWLRSPDRINATVENRLSRKVNAPVRAPR
jgi:predicted GH43/DUF377 family glycosyl hydrolase